MKKLIIILVVVVAIFFIWKAVGKDDVAAPVVDDQAASVAEGSLTTLPDSTI